MVQKDYKIVTSDPQVTHCNINRIGRDIVFAFRDLKTGAHQTKSNHAPDCFFIFYNKYAVFAHAPDNSCKYVLHQAYIAEL
jgi:hypothetical protein